MDCLERKMDNLHSELGLFKNKCSTLEEQNAGLMSQIKRLQVRHDSPTISCLCLYP